MLFLSAVLRPRVHTRYLWRLETRSRLYIPAYLQASAITRRLELPHLEGFGMTAIKLRAGPCASTDVRCANTRTTISNRNSSADFGPSTAFCAGEYRVADFLRLERFAEGRRGGFVFCQAVEKIGDVVDERVFVTDL
jgi:hypothetical protein